MDCEIPVNAIWRFTYTNYKGETGPREVFARQIWFGTTIWHNEPQWFLLAYDLNKKDTREFAMRDMTDVRKFA